MVLQSWGWASDPWEVAWKLELNVLSHMDCEIRLVMGPGVGAGQKDPMFL